MDDWQKDPETVNVASRNGLVTEMNLLIRAGHPVDVMDNRGWSCLHEAAHGGHWVCLEELLKQETVEKNWQSHDGCTALLIACRRNNVQCVVILLKSGADPDICDNVFNFPLNIAVHGNNSCLVKLLIEYGANVNCMSHCGTTPLHNAAFLGRAEILQYLIDHNADLTAVEDYKITPLFSAAHMGHEECLRIILKAAVLKGLKDLVNYPAEDGGTPLFLAAQEGHSNIVQLLLDHGANPNLMTQNPRAVPLHAALQFNYSKCAKLLIPLTDLAVLMECDSSVYEFAFDHSTTSCTSLLVKSHIGPNAKTFVSPHEFLPKVFNFIHHGVHYSRKFRPLILYTTSAYSIEHAKVLLKNGAAVNRLSPFEVPPLLAALNSYKTELAELLVKHHADIDNYHSLVSGNLSVIFSLHNWKGLSLMLKCGAELDSLFSLPTKSKEIPDSGNENQENFNGLTHYQLRHILTLYEILTAARYLKKINIDNILSITVKYSGNIKLDPRIASLVDDSTVWTSLCSLTAQPRKLQHLCRLAIRKCIPAHLLLDYSGFESLPLPYLLKDYLSFLEENDVT